MIPNTKIRVFAFNRTTGAPVTGDAANITAKWAKDYGTRTALTDTNPTEAEDGFYYFDLSTAERTVATIGEIFPESATSGVQVVGVPASYANEPEQPIHLYIHCDNAGRVLLTTTMYWWTGFAWAPLRVYVDTDRPNSFGLDGPGHWHSDTFLPVPDKMFIRFNDTPYFVGNRPTGLATSTTLFVDPGTFNITIGDDIDFDVYNQDTSITGGVNDSPALPIDALGVDLSAKIASDIDNGLSGWDAAISTWVASQTSDITTSAFFVGMLADTSELQTDWANGGRLDTLLDAVKAKTDLIAPGQVYSISYITQTGSIVDVEQYEHETTVPAFSTSADYSATALEIIWELESDNTEVAKLADAGLTKTSSTIAVTSIPTAVRSTVRTLKYAIRVAATEQVIVTGNWIVSRAPRDRS